MKVLPGFGNALLLTYIGDDKNRRFDIRVDGMLITTVDWNGGETGKFYDIVYPLPANLLTGKLSVNINAIRKTFECAVTGSEYETKTCNSCSNKSASVNNGLNGPSVFHHCDGDVLGTFRKVIGAVTLSATGSPDFDCCN